MPQGSPKAPKLALCKHCLRLSPRKPQLLHQDLCTAEQCCLQTHGHAWIFFLLCKKNCFSFLPPVSVKRDRRFTSPEAAPGQLLNSMTETPEPPASCSGPELTCSLSSVPSWTPPGLGEKMMPPPSDKALEYAHIPSPRAVSWASSKRSFVFLNIEAPTVNFHFLWSSFEANCEPGLTPGVPSVSLHPLGPRGLTSSPHSPLFPESH